MTLVFNFHVVISGLTVTLSLSLMIAVRYVLTHNGGRKKRTKDKAAKRRRLTKDK